MTKEILLVHLRVLFVLHLLDISPGGEGLVASSDHDAANRFVEGDFVQSGIELVEELRIECCTSYSVRRERGRQKRWN